MPRKKQEQPETPKRKVGRPRAQIDKTQFEKLCFLQCTQIEFEGFFNVDDVTLNRWCKDTYGMNFSEVFKLKRGKGKISLRRSQFQLAQTNPTMAIWLGKQWLGQTDKQEVVVSVNDDETVKEMQEYFENRKRKRS